MRSQSMWLIVVVATLQLFQLASACNQDATIHVYVDHLQQPFINAYRYSKSVHSSSGFKSAYNSFSTSASGSFSSSGSVLGLASGSLSASVKFALAKVGSQTTSNSRFDESINEQKVEYNPGFLQLIRKVTTTVTINQKFSTEVITEIVDSVPTTSPLTVTERNKRSNDYLKSHFYDDLGNIHGKTYNTACKGPCEFCVDWTEKADGTELFMENCVADYADYC